MNLADIDLDEVLPNGLTRREAGEEYRNRQNNENAKLSSFADAIQKGPFDTTATVSLLNVAMWLIFIAAAILVIMGFNAGPAGAGLIGSGIAAAISGILIKGLSAIVILLREIRDK